MKTKTILGSVLALLLVAGVSTAVVANTHFGQSFGAFTHEQDDHGDGHGRGVACSNLTVGSTLTVSKLSGHFVNANGSGWGNATGTLTFQVSQKYLDGCTLTITGGSITAGKTTYSLTGGTVVFNRGGLSGEGQGTFNGGTFLIGVMGLRGTSTTASVGALHLDLKGGSSELLIHLSSGGLGESEDSGESD